MSEMFSGSVFNGDISKWNVSSVVDMGWMFERSLFNGDISKWDVSSVENMRSLFRESKFSGDLSSWGPLSLGDVGFVNFISATNIPYWAFVPSGRRDAR